VATTFASRSLHSYRKIRAPHYANAASFFFTEKVEKTIASFHAGVTIALLGDVNLNISGNS
jgi:hypothetical protein